MPEDRLGKTVNKEFNSVTRYSMEYSTLETKKFKYAYLELGDKGPTLFFLCGANQEPEFYIRFFKRISIKYKVVVLCYPGIGNRFELSAKHNLENYLNYVEEFVKVKFDKQEFVACGVSLGGLILSNYIAQNRFGNIKAFIGLSILTKLWSKSLSSLICRYLINEKVKYKNFVYESDGLSLFSYKNLKNFRTKTKHTKFALASELSSDEVQKLSTVKILIIVGEKDPIVNISYTKKLFSVLPNTKIIEIPLQNHDAFLGIGDEILKIFDEFLDN